VPVSVETTVDGEDSNAELEAKYFFLGLGILVCLSVAILFSNLIVSTFGLAGAFLLISIGCA
jgi:hypothetical protein